MRARKTGRPRDIAGVTRLNKRKEVGMNYLLAVPFSGQLLFEASAGGLRTTHSAPPPELRQLFSRDAGILQL
jgi:hypothetical protein